MHGRLIPADMSPVLALEGELNIIGRNRSVCNIRICSDRVSQVHCMIFQSDGAIWIQDLDSSNGTRVNGQKIESDTRLKSGDVIHLANEHFTFEFDSASDHAESEQFLADEPESELMADLLNEMQLAKRFDFDEINSADDEFCDSDRWGSSFASFAFFDSVC